VTERREPKKGKMKREKKAGRKGQRERRHFERGCREMKRK
jgi:hypothetical protein